MGNTVQSNLITEDKIISSNWEKIELNSFIKELIKFDFVSLKNKANGKCIDRYLVQFKNLDQEKVYKYYCSKRVECYNLVQIISYESLGLNQLCLQTIKSYVYIQHIPIRLSQIKDIPFNQSMHILQTALFGFEELFHLCGFFDISQDLFCFNYTGKCKVWLNSNLSANQKARSLNSRKKYSEQTMLNEIIKIVEQNTNQANLEQKIMFSQYLENHNKTKNTFESVKFHFKIYCSKFRMVIPQKCSSVFELYKQLNMTHRRKLSTKKVIQNSNSIRIKAYTPNPSRQILDNFSSVGSRKQFQNISMQESTKISIIWQQNVQNKDCKNIKRNAVKKPLTSPRIRTFADDLRTQSKTTFFEQPQISQISYNRMDNNDEKSSAISYLSLSRTSYIDIANENSFILQKKQSLLGNLSGNSPKIDPTEVGRRCKYSTLGASVQIDSLIAQDLLKYL